MLRQHLAPDVLVLYDLDISIHAQYARIALEEAGASYKKHRVELPMGVLEPAIARLNPKLSIPFLSITEAGKRRIVDDSKDIALLAAALPGGEALLPSGAGRAAALELVDQVYKCNGGRLAFQHQMERSGLFSFMLGLVGKARARLLKRYRAAPENADLAAAYDAAQQRLAAPSAPAAEFLEQGRQVAAFFDAALAKSGGPWLLGQQHCLGDALASVWMQWVIWSGAPIALTPRCLEWHARAKQRPAWARADPRFVVSFLMLRFRIVAAVCGALALAAAAAGARLAGVW